MHLPSQLIKSLTGIKGFDKESFELVHALPAEITSIRFNPAKNNSLKKEVKQDEADMQTVNYKPQTSSPVPWSTHGYYLSERPFFTYDPFFHAGCYYVQEASSMFLEQAIKQTVDINTDIKVLDLCAAPGGKSTLLQSIISPGSLLVSNDVIKSRAGIIEENLTKWGVANVIVTNNDPGSFARLENFFDVIVIDAPCSGSGLFRRDPSAMDEWSEENVQLCSQRQQRIIADTWPALKQNGVLIYSTCSYSIKENEEISDWIRESFNVTSCKLSIDDSWGIIETISTRHSAYGYRFWPDRIKGEGFFIACFRKQEGAAYVSNHSKKSKLEFLTKPDQAIVFNWIQKDVPVQLVKSGDSILALPGGMEMSLQSLREASIYIRQAGIRVGKIAGKDFIPDHALAVSTLANDQLVAISLNREQALQYLRKEEVQINEIVSGKGQTATVRPGWAVVRYAGVSIGWVKILKNRINNYYPKEWRIRKK